MIDAVYVPADQLAALFGLSARRIQQLAQQKVLKRVRPGKFHRDEATRQYCEYLRRALLQQGSGTSDSALKKSRTELLKTQRKKAELDLAQKAGELIPIDSLQEVVNISAATYSGQLRSMGSRIASQLAGMNDARAIADKINAETTKILEAVAVEFDALSEKEPSSSGKND